MKLRSALLYLVSAVLFLAGNRGLWKNLGAEWKDYQKMRRQPRSVDVGNMDFEVRRLEYDDGSGRLKNPLPYFQTIRLEKEDFKRHRQVKKHVESGHKAEHASESK